MRDLFDGLLVSCPNNGGLFYLDDGEAIRLDGLDTTGLDMRGKRMLRGLQPDRLHATGSSGRTFEKRGMAVDDIHDTLLGDHANYVVGTHGNEIVQLDPQGDELQRFIFPGEPDSWHINCLAQYLGRVLFSAFGDYREHRAYKLDPLGAGFVQDLHTGDRLITGLSQPHSLAVVGTHLLLANSFLGEIHEYDDAFQLVRKQSLGGYTRGIWVDGDRIYVGLSCSRNRGGGVSSATLVALDAFSWDELARQSLPVNEIYSILKPSTVDLPAVLAANASLAWHVATARFERQEHQLKEAIEQLQGHAAEQESQTEAVMAQLRESLADRDSQLNASRDLLQQTEELHRIAELAVREKQDALQQQGVQLQTMTEELQARKVDAGEMSLQLSRLREALADCEARLDGLQASLSWKLTAPLRACNAFRRRVSGGVRRVVLAIRYASLNGDARHKYTSLARELGPLATVRHAFGFLRRGGPSPEPGMLTEHVFDLRSIGGRPAVILSTQHCRFVAESIAAALNRAGIAARIIYEVPEQGFEDVPHFVICPQMFKQLPDLYVSFQMEQSVSSRWFTADYLRKLENSFAIFDYSLENIEKLVSMGLYAKQFYYLPLGYLPDYEAACAPVEETYDVLFYGDINNERRRACIGELEKVCRVKVVNNLFGQAMVDELRRAKIIVNIHYYPGALLETTRLWECLSLGRLVVSERSSDMGRHEDLLPLVDFVDESNFVDMAARVRYWLDNESARREQLERQASLMASMFHRFDYFFYRFLLASDNISFEDFWRLTGSKYPLKSDRLCLNLPEYADRSASFDRDNRYGFQRFPGLRHAKGWLGCAMSYKYMLRLARQHGLPTVTICEDDVEFPAEFEDAWMRVEQALSGEPSRWDVFSGVLADLSDGTKVLAVEPVGDRDLVLLDRLISMVFNVYNASCYGLVDGWDERNRDVATNTIDRFLERQGQLRVMTTSPFLVGHKEDLHSTLWGGQNTIYSELMTKSATLLRDKIEAWRKTPASTRASIDRKTLRLRD